MSNECPVPLMSAENQSFLEQFYAWKFFGVRDHYRLPARVVDAFYVLEQQWRKAIRDEQ